MIGFLLLIASGARAQAFSDTMSSHPKHSLFGELFGLGNGVSVNYSVSVRIVDQLKGGLRAGFSYIWFDEPHTMLFPLEASVLYGSKHHAEVAAGYTLIYSFYDLGGSSTSLLYDPSPTLTLFAGYRYQSDDGGLFLRLGICTPIDTAPGSSTDLNYQPASRTIPALGVGYTFK